MKANIHEMEDLLWKEGQLSSNSVNLLNSSIYLLKSQENSNKFCLENYKLYEYDYVVKFI